MPNTTIYLGNLWFMIKGVFTDGEIYIYYICVYVCIYINLYILLYTVFSYEIQKIFNYNPGDFNGPN